jgi:formylglycine-generating enzyme required for sulfatase activity
MHLRLLLLVLILPLAAFCAAASYDDTVIEANRLYKADQFGPALAAAESAAKLAPDRFEPHALRALILQSMGRHDDAQKAIEQARALAKPDDMLKVEKIAAKLNAVTAAAKGEPDAAQRRRFNVLNLILEEADKAADPAARIKLQQEFLVQSANYLKTYPDDARVWTLRAKLAVELNLRREGILATRQMQRLGLTNSDDSAIARLIAQIDRKGWLTDRTPNEELEKKNGPEIDKSWVVPGLNLAMVPIPAGSFTMGSSAAEQNKAKREVPYLDFRIESPQHTVSLTKPYWLSQTEVTQSQWQEIMGTNPSCFVEAQLPVENVSYGEALAFCRKLTTREREEGRLPMDYEYTLPTEAQWEYACRAGTAGEYAGGLESMGWYGANSGRKTHPVGQKQANMWGLHDMYGNVWEWCLDWYGNYPSGSVSDITGSTYGSRRVVRGGCWGNDATFCRSAYRDYFAPDHRGSYLGFRLALSSVR